MINQEIKEMSLDELKVSLNEKKSFGRLKVPTSSTTIRKPFFKLDQLEKKLLRLKL